jgi:sugar/nucleoside kinase (ribokinase family)
METGLIGALGSDPESASIQNILTEGKVDISEVVTKRGKGAQRITVTDGAQEFMLSHPGTGGELQIGDVNLDLINTSNFLYLGGAADEKQLWLQKQLISGLNDTVLAFNLDEYPGRGLEELRAILQGVYVIFTTEGVLEAVTEMGLEDAAKAILGEGCELLAVLLADGGATIINQNGEHIARSSVQEAWVKTHAHDAFIAGVVFGLHKGEELDMCAELGCRMVELHAAGENDHFPTREELLEAMAGPPAGVGNVDFVAEQ